MVPRPPVPLTLQCPVRCSSRPALSIRSKTRAGITASVTFDSPRSLTLPCLVRLILLDPLSASFLCVVWKEKKGQEAPAFCRLRVLSAYVLRVRRTSDTQLRLAHNLLNDVRRPVQQTCSLHRSQDALQPSSTQSTIAYRTLVPRLAALPFLNDPICD